MIRKQERCLPQFWLVPFSVRENGWRDGFCFCAGKGRTARSPVVRVKPDNPLAVWAGIGFSFQINADHKFVLEELRPKGLVPLETHCWGNHDLVSQG